MRGRGRDGANMEAPDLINALGLEPTGHTRSDAFAIPRCSPTLSLSRWRDPLHNTEMASTASEGVQRFHGRSEANEEMQMRMVAMDEFRQGLWRILAEAESARREQASRGRDIPQDRPPRPLGRRRRRRRTQRLQEEQDSSGAPASLQLLQEEEQDGEGAPASLHESASEEEAQANAWPVSQMLEYINSVTTVMRYKTRQGDRPVCAICLESYNEEDELRVLPCMHSYHRSCTDQWLLKGRLDCPLCRQRVSEVVPHGLADVHSAHGGHAPDEADLSRSQWLVVRRLHL